MRRSRRLKSRRTEVKAITRSVPTVDRVEATRLRAGVLRCRLVVRLPDALYRWHTTRRSSLPRTWPGVMLDSARPGHSPRIQTSSICICAHPSGFLAPAIPEQPTQASQSCETHSASAWFTTVTCHRRRDVLERVEPTHRGARGATERADDLARAAGDPEFGGVRANGTSCAVAIQRCAG